MHTKPTKITHLATCIPGKGLFSKTPRIGNNFLKVEVLVKHRSLRQNIDFMFKSVLDNNIFKQKGE